MKKTPIILLGFAVTFLPLLSRAADAPTGWPTPDPNITGGNGIFVQAGVVNTEDSSAFQLGAGYGFGLSRNFSVVFDAHYATGFPQYRFTYKGAGKGNTTVLAGYRSLTALVNARLNLSDQDDPFVLYGISGAGPALLMSEAFQKGGLLYGAGTEWSLAFRVGVGFEIKSEKGLAFTFEEDGIFPLSGGLFPDQVGLFSPSYLQTSVGLRLEP